MSRLAINRTDVSELVPNAPPDWIPAAIAGKSKPDALKLFKHERKPHPAIDGKTLDVGYFLAFERSIRRTKPRPRKQKHYRREQVDAVLNYKPQPYRDAHGTWFREEEVVEHGIKRGSLLAWNVKGCPRLGGRKPTRKKIPDLSGRGRRKVWGYLDTDVAKMAASTDCRSRPHATHEWQVTLNGERFDSPRLASKITGLPLHALKPHNRRDRRQFPIPSVKAPLKIKAARSPVTGKTTSVFRHKDCLHIRQLVGLDDAPIANIPQSIVVKNVEDVSAVAASRIARAFQAQIGQPTPKRESISKQADLPRTKKRGRPKGRTKHDPIADAKLVGKWQSSGFKSTEEFDRKEGLPIGSTRSAIDRDRMRRRPEKK